MVTSFNLAGAWFLAGIISTGLVWYASKLIARNAASGSEKSYQPFKEAIHLLDENIDSSLEVMDEMESFSNAVSIEEELQNRLETLNKEKQILAEAAKRLADLKQRVDKSEMRLSTLKSAKAGRVEFLWHANLICNSEHGLLQERIKLLKAVAESLAQYPQSPESIDFQRHLVELSEAMEYYRDTLKISQKRLATLNEDFDELEKNYGDLQVGIKT